MASARRTRLAHGEIRPAARASPLGARIALREPGTTHALRYLTLVLGGRQPPPEEALQLQERAAEVREDASARRAEADVLFHAVFSFTVELTVHVIREQLAHLGAVAAATSLRATEAISQRHHIFRPVSWV